MATDSTGGIAADRSAPDLPAKRLVDLLGLPVVGPDGRVLGHLNDVRLAPTAAVDGVFPQLVVDGLVVDGRHVGGLLGYDRRAEQGPWLVRRLVRLLHRRAGFLPWDAVGEVDWDGQVVRVTAEQLGPLEPAG